MKLFLFICSFLSALVALGQSPLSFEEAVKQRVFVLTDITNEPDDQQSLVRFLVYANEYDIEGIVATTSTHLRTATRKDKITELIKNYGLVWGNLNKHSTGFPEAEHLLSLTTEHQPLFGMEGVGEGMDSEGSELLIQAVDKQDNRPLWVSVWGGANCLAQALWKVKNTRSETEVAQFVAKLRVYTISDQDFAGPWIRHNFPGIFYMVDASAGDSWLEYYKATWTGIAGDRWYKNGPMLYFDLVDNPWLRKHIMENHGPLGANYLDVAYIMEGDTPSFLGLINNGLAWYKSPSYGGWGGRYDFYKSYGEVAPIWTSSVRSQDEVLLPDGRKEASNQATIWRWRKAFQHDFAARMDWNITKDLKGANHNPIVVLNGNEGKSMAKGLFAPGSKVTLSAQGTYDPDGDMLSYNWWVYNEVSGFSGKLDLENRAQSQIVFEMPQLEKGQELHLILEVEDNGTPALTSYRRTVLTNTE